MIPPRPVRRLALPLLIAGELVILGLAVAFAALGLLLIGLDRRARVLRIAAMAGHYILIELTTLGGFLALWLLGPVRGRRWTADRELRLVAWALGSVLAAGRRWVGFRVEVEEPPNPAPFDTDRPALVLARHGGIGDSFTVAWLLAHRYRRRPRVVLKSILLADPLLDVALTRMGACWIPSRGKRRGPAAVASIAKDVGPGQALLLFPEGENWTPRRRLRVLNHLWRSGRSTALRSAALMEHVLAPRPGGVMASLETRPDLPVVVVAHSGLDRVTSAGQLWRAVPFHTPMRLRWWPAATVPADPDARVDWLTTEWAVVDEWIDGTRGSTGSPLGRRGAW